MKLVRNQPRARRLPTRRRYALARLVALLTFRFEERVPEGIDHVVYAMDRDHDKTESYFVASMFAALTIIYTAALLPFGRSISIVVAIAASPVTLQLPIYVAGALSGYRLRDLRSFQSAFHMLVLIAPSLYFARTTSPARFVAWTFLTLCGMNMIAAVIMFFARGRVARMEAECGI